MVNLTKESKDMVDGELHKQISRIEEDIDKLTKTVEGCRKAALLSKVGIAAGSISMLAYVVGAVWFDSAIMIGAIAAIIGGVVVFGSNARTLRDAMLALEAAKQRRNQLIDMLRLRTVHSDSGRFRG